MQLTMRVGAAIGMVAIAGCSQSTTQDNNASADANTAMSVNETTPPADNGTGESDTLGNQLNQLNESGSDAAGNEENSSVDQ